MPVHGELPSVHKGSYWTPTDPADDDANRVEAGKSWIDTSLGPPYQLKVRNADNTAWQNVGARVDTNTGGGGGGGGGGDVTVTQNEALAAQGAAVTAVSELLIADGGSADQVAENAIDANDETEWWPAAGETLEGAWIEVDLGAPKEITKYRVFQSANSGYRATGIALQWSDDGGPGGTWADATVMASPIDTGPTNLPTPLSHQHWRLLCTGAPVSTFWGIRTFELISVTTTPGTGSLTWQGPWDSATDYVENDLVSILGSTYIALVDNANVNPSADDGSTWAIVAAKGDDGPPGADGLVWRGPWSGATAYVVDDTVSSAGSSYVCILAHTNHVPPNATYWNLVAAKGDTGSGGGSAHIIQDEGVDQTVRANLNFVGAGVTVTDDSGADATVVSIAGGGGGGVGGGYMVDIVIPPTTGWAWVNQATAAASVVDDVVILADDTPGSGNGFRGYEQTVAVPFVVTMLIVPNNTPMAYATAGVYMHQVGGALLGVHWQFATDNRLKIWSWQADLTTVSELQSIQIPATAIWIRISDDGTTVKVQTSLDGRHFGTVYTSASDAVVTDPDAVGLMVNAVDHESSVSLISWDVT